MNSVYIGAGLTIILALLAALVGPLFVDWTAYRAVFEREGTALIGRPVTVLGSADARLLPAPWIAFDDVVIGDLAHPLAKIGRFEMRLELTPLLKGEIRVAEMHLDRPVVQVALGADGKIDLGPTAATGGRSMAEVALEQAEITDGKLVLEDRRGGGTVAIGAINANASAAALVGPWKFEGGGAWGVGVGGDRPVTFRLASGRQGTDGAWPLKLQAGFADDPAQATFDATVSVADGRPNAGGTLVVTRALPPNVEPAPEDLPPLRVEAKIKADAAGIVADQLDITVGAEDRAYLLSGTGGITLGAQPAIEARLAAKQIDLDRALAGKVGEAVDVAETLSRGGAALRRLPQPPVPARLSLTLPGLVLGGGVVQDVRLEARSRPGGWAIDAIEAKLPGRTKFNADGRLALDERLGFDGAMKIVSDQPAAFANWWSRARDLPRLEPIDAEAKLSMTPEAIKVDQLIARIGTATTRGFVEWAPGRVPAEGGRLRAALTADRLDIDQVSALRTLLAGSAAPAGIGERRNGIGSAELDFDAGTLVVAGVALKGVSARGVVAEDVLSIDRFQVRDAAGASIEAHGRIERPATTPDGRIDLKLSADRPEALARVVDALAGGAAWSKRLVAAAPALGPLAVNATLEGRASTSVSDVRATVNGTSAGSTLALDGRFTGRVEAWRDATVEVSGGLDGPDGARVLRQLGVTALSFKGATGRVSATANGVPGNGLDAAATVDIAGTRLGYVGTVKLPADGAVQLDGKATVAAKDVVQAALVLGQPLPGLDRTLGLDLAAKVSGAWPRLAFAELAGHAADTEVRGAFGVDFAALPVAVSGQIGLGEIDLGGLAELGLGSGAFEAPLKAGEIWSGQPLGAPILGRSVRLDLDLTADRALIGPHRLDRAGLKLSTRVDEVGLEGLKAAFGPGTAAGTLRIKRGSNGETTVSGDVKLAGIALEDVVWRRDGRSVASGRLDLDATFEGGGRSLAAIAAGLNGRGAVRATAGVLRYVNPDAFRAIIVAADGGLDLKEDKVRTVFQSYLDNGQMPFDRLDAAFSMAGGVARAGEAAVESALARTRGSVAFDLARWKLDADWTLTVDPGKGNTVTGAQAQVGVVFSGPLDRPSRRLDVAPLAAFLTLRAFEREVARIEAMQADIMERERFARELRRLRQENTRRVQEQQAEEARKADEARRAAEAARKAEEERKRQLEAPKPAGQIDPPAGSGSAAASTSNGRATTAQANEVGPGGGSGSGGANGLGGAAVPNGAAGQGSPQPGAAAPSLGPSPAAGLGAAPSSPAAPDALPPLDPTIQIAPAPPVLGSPRPATGGNAPLVLSPSGTQ